MKQAPEEAATLYERLSALGLKLAPAERDALGTIEYALRKLEVKYRSDDLREIADQLSAVNSSVVKKT